MSFFPESGLIEWQADSFLLGFMKDLFYHQKLKVQNIAKFEKSDIIFCKDVCNCVLVQLLLCIDHKRGHFEHCKLNSFIESLNNFPTTTKND